jgi:hypothetical protein
MPEFDCSRDVVVPAAPERVWEAVATTEGNAAWLFPNEIDADGAGAKAWDPPHRFAIRQEQGDWFNALECVIEARDGGTTDGFERLRRALGLDERISEGDSVQLTRPDAEPVKGIVDYLRPNFVGMGTPGESFTASSAATRSAARSG